MTRTRWRSSRAHSRTSGLITARPTRPCKVRVPPISPLATVRSELTLSTLGQKLFTQGDKSSLANIDRQIFRIIGKATTLAAYVSYAVHTVEPATAELATGWPIVSVRVVSSSRRRRASHILGSASLLVRSDAVGSFDVFPPLGSYTRWTTLARRTTSRLPCSRKHSTCYSFCTLTTNSMQVAPRCFRQAAHWWTHILLWRQFFL